MAAAVDLRGDFTAHDLRRLARASRDARQTRRLLSLSAIYDGASRTGLPRLVVLVFRSFVTGSLGSTRRGLTVSLTARHQAKHQFSMMLSAVRWPEPLRLDQRPTWTGSFAGVWSIWFNGCLRSLAPLSVARHWGASCARWVIANCPRARSTTHKTPMPSRPLKKGFPAELAAIREKLAPGTEVEIWWQDEARVGQKNTITRRWAQRGTRPRAPRDQRTRSAYIFGAICPEKGKGAGLVMPPCKYWGATPMRCRRISTRSERWSRQTPMPSSSSIKQAGICPTSSISLTISPCCPCRRERQK